MTASVTSSPRVGRRGVTERPGRSWHTIFMVVYGAWVFLPYLAPVLMQMGWTGPGNAIYFIYSFFCHQLPERSYFLFGRETMYSLNEIQAAWHVTNNPMILRGFTGTAEMGWKVAWSDRMISFYTSVWLFALVWYVLRRKVKPLAWWGLALLLFPLAVDGGTHFLSDLQGIGEGFRFTNDWLASLTGNVLPVSFYVGDGLGSFNSWMRLITGTLAGWAIVWFAFPHLQASFGTD